VGEASVPSQRGFGPAYNSRMPIIPEDSDPAALIAQADIHRFYVRVIQPALMEFAPTDDVIGLETNDLEVYLDAARQNTHNALCYEMRRTFALVIGGLFERQLRFWLSGKMPSEAKEIEKEKWSDLIERAKVTVGGTVITEMADIEILWSVANAVRHGNGRATSKLLRDVPQFWDQVRRVSKLGWKSDLAGNMRICDADLEKYLIAVLRFWHRAGASQVPMV
jgi:hypothetical protein